MSKRDTGSFRELAFCGADVRPWDPIKERAHLEIVKEYRADCPLTGHRAGDIERRQYVGNIVMNGGASLLWERAYTRNPTTALNAALSALSTGSMIGVGTSTASSGDRTVNDLQAANNSTSRHGAVMSATSYPAHTDGTSSSGARQIVFRGVFTTAQANFVWNEWGIFNGTSGGPSTAFDARMLNRSVTNLGTKTSAAQWTFTATIAIN